MSSKIHDHNARFEVFETVKFYLEFFWVVAPFGVVVGGGKVLQNADILPQHQTASQARRPRLDTTRIIACGDKTRQVNYFHLVGPLGKATIWKTRTANIKARHRTRF